jgi:hypothetical protein
MDFDYGEKSQKVSFYRWNQKTADELPKIKHKSQSQLS